MLRKLLCLGLVMVMVVCAVSALAEEGVEVLKADEGFSGENWQYPAMDDLEHPYVSGTFVCDSPDAYKIITLIRVTNVYGPKPYFDEPYAFIAPSGTFQAEFAAEGESGDLACTEIYLYFVPEDYEHNIEVNDSYAVKAASANALLKDSVYAVKIVR